jgi:hypothetical protein
VGEADCKAVPADESSSMTSTQTALASHKGLSRGTAFFMQAGPLARACKRGHRVVRTTPASLSPSISVYAALDSVVYVWRALVHAGDRAECADEQGPHQAAEWSEAPEMETGRWGDSNQPTHMLKTGSGSREICGGGCSVGGVDCKAVPADESAA